MDDAFQYAIDNGMCLESAYPYTFRDGKCQKCDPVIKMSSCVDVTKNDQVDLKEAVSRGPVSTAIEADTKTFQLHTGSIIASSACGTNLDHGVLIVGYGFESGTENWLVKNSWTFVWGDNGYAVKIERSHSTRDPGMWYSYASILSCTCIMKMQISCRIKFERGLFFKTFFVVG